jgi:hypothetical protein
MSAYKEEFAGGSISYNIPENRWEYEINGKRGHRSSLNAARQAIDDFGTVEKKFDRHPALHSERYHNDGKPTPVTVTSYEQGAYSRDIEVWISFKDGHKTLRKRVKDYHLFEDTESNHEKFAEMTKIDQQIEALNERKSQIRNKLTAYKLRKQ